MASRILGMGDVATLLEKAQVIHDFYAHVLATRDLLVVDLVCITCKIALMQFSI
jgi:signal recognition particle GTPase